MTWEKLRSVTLKASPTMTWILGIGFLLNVAQFDLLGTFLNGVAVLIWADIWKDYTEAKNDGKMDSKPTRPLE